MSKFIFKTHQLLSGERTPATGNYVLAAQANTMSAVIRATGVNSSPRVAFYYPSPFDGSDVEFFTKTFTADGYYNIPVTGLPIAKMKAGSIATSATSTGYFWVAVNQQLA